MKRRLVNILRHIDSEILKQEEKTQYLIKLLRKGFIINPQTDEKNSQWHDLATRLPNIMDEKRSNIVILSLEHEISKFTECNLIGLSRDQKLTLMRDLCFIQNAIIFAEPKNKKHNIIPDKLANPLISLANELGIPAQLSYLHYVLLNPNQERVFTSDDSYKVDTLTSEMIKIKTELGQSHNDERHFIDIYRNIEGKAVKMFDLMANLFEKKADKKDLSQIAKIIKEMRGEMNMMHFGTSKKGFNYFREFLKGSDLLENEINGKGIYSQLGKYVSCHTGASGAQTPLFAILDAFLGVDHDARAKIFLEKQAEFFLPKQRELIEFIKTEAMAIRQQYPEEIATIATELGVYRASHMRMVDRFIGGGVGICGTDRGDTLERVKRATDSAQAKLLESRSKPQARARL